MKKYIAHIIVGVVALVAGISIGASPGSTEKPVAAPETVVQTVTATPEPPEAVEVYRTPTSCLNVIKHAEDVSRRMTEMINVFVGHIEKDQGLMDALSVGSYGQIETYVQGVMDDSDVIADINSRLTTSVEGFNTNKELCSNGK